MRGLLAALLLATGCDIAFRVDRLGAPNDALPDTVAEDVSSAGLRCDQSPIILRPNGVFSQEWAEQYPDSGSHLDKVIDDAGPDDDATYIATTADAKIDLFTHMPISTSVTVKSATIWARTRLETAATPAAEVGTILRVNDAPFWADRVISGSWSDYSDVRVKNPATLEPWTVDAVNAMTFGVRKAYEQHRVLVTRVWASIECQ